MMSPVLEKLARGLPGKAAAEVAIVVVNYNGTADTVQCLDSLRQLTGARCLTIVVDNGSAPAADGAIAAAHPWATVVRREHNGGWAGGNNVGIRLALAHGVEHVVLLNNDTTVHPEVVNRLLLVARKQPRFGIIGPVISAMDQPAEVMTDGCFFNEASYPGFFQRKTVPLDGPNITEVDIVNGCCMMVASRVFRRIGLLDERFFLVHEESDFCLRARRAHFRCGILGEALVWHKGSRSFQRAGKTWQRYYDARNLHLLLQKHLAHHRRRGPWRSRLEYLKYVYYRYAIECEQGRPAAAAAVLEGVNDALEGRYGPYVPSVRSLVPGLRLLFECWRRHRGRQPRREGVHAAAVCQG